MKAIIQKVLCASVTVEEQMVGSIEKGLVVLIGFSTKDSQDQLRDFATKIVQLRCFETAEDHFGDNLVAIQGGLLIVSQFTLYADCRKGRRPSFTQAAKAEVALPLYERFVEICKEIYPRHLVQTGIFGAHMKVTLVNEGPMTLEMEM